MRNFIATAVLAVVLITGICLPANASSATETENHFSWSSVISKVFLGTLIVAPAVVYFSLNNRKGN